MNSAEARPELSSYPWIVSDDVILPPIPLFYPLEKTHLEVTDVTPSLIVRRISKCLKELSIAYVVDGTNVKIDAETMDHVRFKISLYSGSINTCSAIIELQRLSGCCISFHYNCKTILQAAAEGFHHRVERPALNPSNHPVSSVINDLELDSRKALSKPRMISRNQPVRKPEYNCPKISDSILESIELVSNLLKKDRLDANLLGLESLRLLTNPAISGLETALFSAGVVLNGTGEDDNIPETLKSLVQYCRLSENDLDEDHDFFDKKYYSLMRNHALGILADSLQLYAMQGNLSRDFLENENSWLSNVFVSCLMEELEELSYIPGRLHDGLYSAKCLNVLVRHSNTVRELAIEKGAIEMLKLAFFRYQCSHDILTNEIQQVQIALTS